MDNMERDVTKLWLQVLAGEKHAYRVSNGNIIADGRLGDYVYNQVCIENNKVRLYEFIDFARDIAISSSVPLQENILLWKSPA